MALVVSVLPPHQASMATHGRFVRDTLPQVLPESARQRFAMTHVRA